MKTMLNLWSKKFLSLDVYRHSHQHSLCCLECELLFSLNIWSMCTHDANGLQMKARNQCMHTPIASRQWGSEQDQQKSFTKEIPFESSHAVRRLNKISRRQPVSGCWMPTWPNSEAAAICNVSKRYQWKGDLIEDLVTRKRKIYGMFWNVEQDVEIYFLENYSCGDKSDFKNFFSNFHN